MIRAGWVRIVNISMNHETMRLCGFSPYGPSKAVLESEAVIWSRDVDRTGVSVNALLPGGATLTLMIPDSVDTSFRAKLIEPDVIVPPLLWLCSPLSDGATGQRWLARGSRTGPGGRGGDGQCGLALRRR